MVDKAAANKAKNAGNIAFKAKDFDTAITSYNTAIELDPEEVRRREVLCYVMQEHIALSQRYLHRSFRSAQLISYCNVP